MMAGTALETDQTRHQGGGTWFRDRESAEIRRERVFGERGLHILYETWLGRQLSSIGPLQQLATAIYGRLQSLPLGQRKIRTFVDELGIDLSEAERPIEVYRNLNEFFMRKLKPGARPIDPNPKHLLSPADGRLTAHAELTQHQVLEVKACRVTLNELLLDECLADQFYGGTAIVVRLAPADYHRFHFPDSGAASGSHRVGRRLHAVHPVALASGARSFLNRRMISTLETENFGRVVLIEVGALLVAAMKQTYTPGPVQRGQQKGFFHFGGSTVIMLTEPGRMIIDADLLKNTRQGLETFVKVGTRIAISS